MANKIDTSAVGLDQTSFTAKVISAIKAREKEYAAFRFIFGTVEANSTQTFFADVTNLGPFKVDRIKGSYETLYNIGGVIVDNGVNYLMAKISDQGRSRNFMDSFVPLPLLLSPGRIRSQRATNNNTDAAPSQQLFFPLDFEYIFASSSKIQVDIKNDSNVPLYFDMLFEGRRIVEPTANAYSIGV